MNNKLRLFSLILFVFFLDRILKIMVVHHYSEGQGFSVLPGIFSVTRVNNTGAAFGMLKGYGVVLIAVSLVSILFLVGFLLRRRAVANTAPEWAWSLVAAGALGNLVDRVYYGYVVDFLDFKIWPVFNVADASICLGVFWLALHFLPSKKSKGGV